MDSKEISVRQSRIDVFRQDPSLLMGKGEYNKYIKEQKKEALSQKQRDYYDLVNNIIDCANTNKDTLVIKETKRN